MQETKMMDKFREFIANCKDDAREEIREEWREKTKISISLLEGEDGNPPGILCSIAEIDNPGESYLDDEMIRAIKEHPHQDKKWLTLMVMEDIGQLLNSVGHAFGIDPKEYKTFLKTIRK